MCQDLFPLPRILQLKNFSLEEQGNITFTINTPGACHGVIAGEAVTMQNVNLWDGSLHTLHLSEVSLQILTTETCMQTGY